MTDVFQKLANASHNIALNVTYVHFSSVEGTSSLSPIQEHGKPWLCELSQYLFTTVEVTDEVLAVHQDKVQHFMNVNIDKAKKLLGQAEIAARYFAEKVRHVPGKAEADSTKSAA